MKSRIAILFAANLLTTPFASAAAPKAPATSAEAEQVAQAKKFFAQIDALDWIHGPASVPIGDQATMKLPRGARYLDPQQTSRFLKLNGNPPVENSYAIAPEDLVGSQFIRLLRRATSATTIRSIRKLCTLRFRKISRPATRSGRSLAFRA